MQKMLISSEVMGHRMRLFDTILELPNVVFLLESHRSISCILGNIWSTSVDFIVDFNIYEEIRALEIHLRCVVLRDAFL
eukprot:UN01998